MSNRTEHSQTTLTPAWLAAGSALFGIAIATPLFVLNYLPQVNALETKPASEIIEAVVPLAAKADNPRDYPGMVLAANDVQVGETMGSLATLIDEQGADTTVAPVSAVRRMIVDAVAVDMESSTTADLLEHVRVPIRDCDVVGTAPEGLLIDEGAKLTSALHSLQTGWEPDNLHPIAGPLARDYAVTHEGMRIEYCADLRRIHAVALLPLPPGQEPVAAMVAADLVYPIAEHSEMLASHIETVSGTVSALKPRSAPKTIVQGDAGNLDISVVPESIVLTGVTAQDRAKPVIEADDLASMDVAPATHAEADHDPIDHSVVEQIEVAESYQGALKSADTFAAPKTPKPATAPALLAMNGEAFGVSTDMSPAMEDIRTSDQQRRAEISPLAPTLQAPVDVEPSVFFAQHQTIEDELRLNKKGRWRTQLRLTLIGHDPKGIDGIFGTGTRKAIAALQSAEALPATGYLDAKTLTVLKQKSNRRYAKWLERRAQKRAEQAAQKLAAAAAPQKVSSVPTARRAPGCARDGSGVIISNQSFGCDWKVLREGLGSLFGSSS